MRLFPLSHFNQETWHNNNNNAAATTNNNNNKNDNNKYEYDDDDDDDDYNNNSNNNNTFHTAETIMHFTFTCAVSMACCKLKVKTNISAI